MVQPHPNTDLSLRPLIAICLVEGSAQHIYSLLRSSQNIKTQSAHFCSRGSLSSSDLLRRRGDIIVLQIDKNHKMCTCANLPVIIPLLVHSSARSKIWKVVRLLFVPGGRDSKRVTVRLGRFVYCVVVKSCSWSQI
jgi:hypothetical protein